MELIGYISALVIGISLGLIGGGGSILTVPVLVYLFRIQPVLATAYSLFIVGSTSLIGAVPKYRQGMICMKTAFIFGIPSILAVFVTRKYILPWIPEMILKVGNLELSKNLLMMVLFAILMILASVSMIRDKEKAADPHTPRQFNYPLIVIEGLIVGILTGLVGAGGGFLIIPALVLLSKLPMKQAVGTSLLIIAAKSLIGFTGDLSNYQMDWNFLLVITAIAIAGIFVGNWLNKKMDSRKLKKGFGWFVLVMGIYILLKEMIFNEVV